MPPAASQVPQKLPIISTKNEAINICVGDGGDERMVDLIEVFEGGEIGESLKVRTQMLASLHGLGHNDLVHIVKRGKRRGKSSVATNVGASAHAASSAHSAASSASPNAGSSNQVGSWMFALGVDCTSSASIAAYMNTLSYSLRSSPGWFASSSFKRGSNQANSSSASTNQSTAGKGDWKIVKSIYCCWNPFSKVDLRVEARIPGGVACYAVDRTGERISSVKESWWEEALVASRLREIFSFNGGEMDELSGFGSEAAQMDGVVGQEEEEETAVNTITNYNETSFDDEWIKIAHKLLLSGGGKDACSWKLGSPTHTADPSAPVDYLSLGVLRWFALTGRAGEAVRFFKELPNSHPSLHARSLFLADRESEAVKCLFVHDDAHCTHLQSTFLLGKGRVKEALFLAERALSLAPKIAHFWINLAACQRAANEHGNALSTLNRTPLTCGPPSPSASNEAFIRCLAGTATIWNPNVTSTLLESTNNKASSTPPDLLLEGLEMNWAALSPVMRQAYWQLVGIVSDIGWDALLSLRSKIFLMEQEWEEQAVRLPKDRKEDLAKSEADAADEESRLGSCGGIENEMVSVNLSKDEDTNDRSQLDPSTQKILCEKWFDTLFTTLYQDLRTYTVFKAELQHFRKQDMVKRSKREWTILGNVCWRLGKWADGRAAYRHCLGDDLDANCKFASKVHDKFDKIAVTLSTIAAASRSFKSPANKAPKKPSLDANLVNILSIIKSWGLTSCRNTMSAMKLSQSEAEAIEVYFRLACDLKSTGFDY